MQSSRKIEESGQKTLRLPADAVEVYAHGARIKHTVPERREFTLDDFGSKEAEEYYDRIYNSKSKPAVQVIESEVQEIL